MSPRTRPGVAAFDFDGTLTHGDTFLPFLRRAAGTHRVAGAAAWAALRSRTRDGLKFALLARLFTGWPAARLDALGEAYAADLGDRLRVEMVERLRRHQADGHVVVVVSASLGAYLRPLAATLGIDGVLAVEMEAGPGGALTGRVAGGRNTRGPAKVARLRTWLAAHVDGGPVELWAYGDSAGDAELLAAADHPTWVRPRRRPAAAR